MLVKSCVLEGYECSHWKYKRCCCFSRNVLNSENVCECMHMYTHIRVHAHVGRVGWRIQGDPKSLLASKINPHTKLPVQRETVSQGNLVENIRNKGTNVLLWPPHVGLCMCVPAHMLGPRTRAHMHMHTQTQIKSNKTPKWWGEIWRNKDFWIVLEMRSQVWGASELYQ